MAQSNAFSIAVQLPAGSALGAAAQALSANAWGTWTMGNVFNADPDGTGDSVFSYCQRATWDTANKRLMFLGGCHGSGGASSQMFLNRYSDSTNTWASPLRWQGGYNLYEHAYYNGAVDSDTGDFYGRNAFGSTNTVYRYGYASSAFTSFATPANGNYGICLDWHPGLAGGSLVFASYWGAFYRSRGASSWTTITTAEGAVADNDPACAYVAKDSSLYLGGGTTIRRLTAAGAWSTIAAPPRSVGVWSAGSSGSTSALIPSGNPSNGLLLVSRDGQIREYNAGSNSWGSVLTTAPSAITSVPDGGWIACACPTYNCVVFIKRSGPTSVSNVAHIWKH